MGFAALGANTTGGSNVALGQNALDANTTGSWNTAISQDADKFLKALQSVYKDINDYGIGVGTAQRSIKYFSPIFGTAPRRLAQQFQTKGQEETYVKYRRGIVRGRILDYLLDGNNEEAGKTISAWNRTYPEKAFFYDDIGAEALFDRLEKKYKKRLNPYSSSFLTSLTGLFLTFFSSLA